MHELKNLTPIDTLPDELLLRIFSILIGWDAINCGHWDGKRLWNRDKRICQDWTRHATVISRVNKSWRRLAINTSSFWSHIDLFFEHGYWLPLSGAFRRCLARVKDAPIELHINCGQMQRFYTTAVLIPSCILRDRTVTSLIVTASYPALIQPIVGAYLNEATCSSLTKLQVEFISPEQSVVCVPAPEQPNQQQLFENLLRLNTLRLSGASMNWASARFSGLVELQLCNMQVSPSMDQIYDILAASPELCTVELDRLHPTSYVLTGSRSKSRIKLPKLSYLHLGGKVYDFVDRLLQVIEPGIGQLCLKLSILEASSNELESLRIWNNVSILSLSVPGLPATLLSQMLSQKGLTTLVLADQCIGDFYLVPNAADFQNRGLRRIVLRRCCIALEAIRCIASIHSVHSLWVESCTYTSGINDIISLELPEAELDWLEDAIPDLYIDYAHHGQMRSGLPWWLG